MKEYDMKQCTLKKRTASGNAYTVSWIPSSYAQKGRAIDVKENNVWLRGWMVSEVYKLTKKSREVMKDRDNYKNQRKASDI